MAEKIQLFALSTCVYCQAIKKMFDDLEIDYHYIEADSVGEEEQEKVMEELKRINPKCSFPTTLIGEQVITGFKAQEIKERLGIRTPVDDLFDRLKSVNEKKGYYFNRNKEHTYQLIRGLLTNKDRYGYMACPCRLASGKKEKDKDIICPCDYREPDVLEFGSCFCGLYVSADWNEGRIEREEVPERRSME